MAIPTLSTSLIVVMIALILSSLGTGLYYLVTDKGRSKKAVNALTFRIVLSFSLFLSLFFAFSMGWISPHPL